MTNSVSLNNKSALLPLPVGNSDWAEIRSEYWSADKTQLISGLLDRKTTVALFTRPRRFGKTTAMRMIQAFFEKTESGNAQMFEGTKVWQDSKCREEQGKYPVIFITFKDAKGRTWEETQAFIGNAVAQEFLRHEDVFSSEKCKPEWKAISDAVRFSQFTGVQLATPHPRRSKRFCSRWRKRRAGRSTTSGTLQRWKRLESLCSSTEWVSSVSGLRWRIENPLTNS